ncbi:MAG TPA: sulfotransferase domain-containing protein [Rhizomicrobium sp.]|jgi:hypothetical protein|nr:sulfotransferase domain-containing protein [Rhizomicrobium sp.]
MKTGGRIVLCAGLKSSGSTWLYNAVIQLMRFSVRASGDRRPVRSFYAEDVATFPPAARQTDSLIIKTHIPSPALRFLVRFTGGTVLISVREPRDAIASLMQRFDHEFDTCLEEVSAGAAAVLELANSGGHLLLRYESRFTQNRTSLTRIASYLGAAVNRDILEKIRSNLTPENVTRKVEALRRKGAFGRKPNPNSFDPLTHWHPGHVGDRRIGKYAEVLSSAQQRATLRHLHEYCRTFGYPTLPPSRAKKRR